MSPDVTLEGVPGEWPGAVHRFDDYQVYVKSWEVSPPPERTSNAGGVV